MAVPADVIAGEIIEADWGNTIRDWACLNEVDEATDVGGPVALTTTAADVASVILVIPSDWASWTCVASADGVFTGLNTLSYRLRIDGTDSPERSFDISAFERGSLSVGFRRTGLVTTGSRSVSLRAREGGPGNISLQTIHLYARAVRTS